MRNSFGRLLMCSFLVFPALLLADRPAQAEENKGKDCACANCAPVCTYTYSVCTYEVKGKCYVWHNGWGVVINGVQYPVTRKGAALAALGGSRSVSSGYGAASQFSLKGTSGAQSVQSSAAVLGAIDGSARRGRGKTISAVEGETLKAAKGAVDSSQALIARTGMSTIRGATPNATSAAVVSQNSAVLSATMHSQGAGAVTGRTIGLRPR